MKQFLQFVPARGSSLPIYCLQNRRNDSLNLRKGILNDDRIERGIGHSIEIFNATDFTGAARPLILSFQVRHPKLPIVLAAIGESSQPAPRNEMVRFGLRPPLFAHLFSSYSCRFAR